jgi:putative hydrolase of the HAD superfamily
MYPYRAVLFDFFGTLTRAVSRGPAHTRIARGLGCNPAEFTAQLDESFLCRARGGYGSAADALRRVAYALNVEPTSDQIRDALAARLAAVRSDTRLRSDAVPVLKEIRRRGLRTAVVSDCTHELPQIMPTLPVAPLLDAVVYSIDVGLCKPDPEIYLAACERLAVTPHECLYVGDGGSQELSGARALGMGAVRLAAPDLAEHLCFNGETDWQGWSVESLAAVLQLLDAVPAGGNRRG